MFIETFWKQLLIILVTAFLQQISDILKTTVMFYLDFLSERTEYLHCKKNSFSLKISQGGGDVNKNARLTKGGFPVMAKITRCHTFKKEINHSRARSQCFNENCL